MMVSQHCGLVLRQAQHEELDKILTLSFSKGEAKVEF